MPFCPKCGIGYIQGAKSRPNCGVQLGSKLVKPTSSAPRPSYSAGTASRVSHRTAALLIMLLLVIGGVAYFSFNINSIAPSLACGQYQLVLTAHSVSGTQAFTTWYSCYYTAATFRVTGHVWDKSTDQTNDVHTGSAVTIGPHQYASVVSQFNDYRISKISELQLYAYNSQSYAQLYSQTYSFYP